MIESSIVLHKGNIIDYNIGNFSSVEFNFERVWKYYKIENINSTNLIFLHVHPRGLLELSELDKNCMKGFYQAFGKEIYFYIITYNDDDLFSISYNVVTYMITKNLIQKIPEYQNIIINNNILLFLKYLSYGERK